MKKISIIVPIYNVCTYLDQCLKSILEQTYSNLEVILINDCSTDKSEEICLKYLNLYNNIKYYKLNENKGVSYVRNFGLDAASGSLIGFVDSDDWIEKNMFDTLYRIMEEHNTSIAICHFNTHVNENNNANIIKSFISNNVYINNVIDALYCCINSNIILWNKLYQRDLFRNIRFPNGKEYEDNFIMHLLVEKAEKIAISKEYLYNSRRRPNSITTKDPTIRSFDGVYSSILRYEYLHEKYDADMLEKLCRKIIFNSLFRVTDRIIKNKTNEVITNELLSIRDYIFSKYKYEDCGLNSDDEKLLLILKTSLRHYTVARKMKEESEI